LIRSIVLSAALLTLAVAGRAEKKVSLKIAHPPALAALAGRPVTLGQVTGDCSKEFADLVVQDMRAHGVTVDGGTGAVVLSIDVSRCEGRPQQPILGEGLPAVHISRTDGWFAAQLRIADPASGQELASFAVHGHAQKDNQSQTASPEWPAPAELKVLALRQAIAEAQRLYAPWTENRELPFMDSKDCHMKQAYDLAKNSEYQGVVSLLEDAAGACAAKPAMEASYDLGVAYFALGKYAGALAAFEKASGLNGGKLTAALEDECRKESAIIQARQARAAPAASGPPVQTGMVMTNDLVIKMIDGNIAEAEVLRMIANQPGRFSLEPADLARLKAASVPDSIFSAMRNKK